MKIITFPIKQCVFLCALFSTIGIENLAFCTPAVDQSEKKIEELERQLQEAVEAHTQLIKEGRIEPSVHSKNSNISDRLLKLENRMDELEKKRSANVLDPHSDSLNSQPKSYLEVGPGLSQYEQGYHHLKKAQSLYQTGDLKSALEHARLAERNFSAVIRNFPDDPMVSKALLHRTQMQLFEAHLVPHSKIKPIIDIFHTLISLQLPDNQKVDAYLGLIEACLLAQKKEEAQQYLKDLKGSTLKKMEHHYKNIQLLDYKIKNLSHLTSSSDSDSDSKLILLYPTD